MTLAIAALVSGIIILALSADKFVEGAAVTARTLGIPPLLIGMLVIGFGSSLPEVTVSVIAATEGNAGLALGNALGSNITNIALILGVTAIIKPVTVQSGILTRELPILIFVTMVCTLLLGLDGVLSTADGWILITTFACLMTWTIYTGLTATADQLATEVDGAIDESISTRRAIVYMIAGLIVLVLSSRLMIWGGVGLARQLGISDVLIGLTVVALGTSLPELAASITAVMRNEHDLALGNVIGSNLFNTTLVIGIAGAIVPTTIEQEMIVRDLPILIGITFLLFVACYNFRQGTPQINRKEATAFLFCYLAYNALLIFQAIPAMFS